MLNSPSMYDCDNISCSSSINTILTDPNNKIINLYTDNGINNNTIRNNNTVHNNNEIKHIIKKTSIPNEIEPSNSFCCKICNNDNNINDNYTILSCNHVFHVYCLVDYHYNDSYRLNMIDSDYFASRKCPTCNKTLQTEELMFIHSKFLSYTKDKVESHHKNILNLENQFNKIKEELRICYEYKQKLDNEREKSKQIVTSLMTLI